MLLIFFRKAEEDDVQVVYIFGPSRKSLHRRLVFDKVSAVARPSDGEIDLMFEGAIIKIRRLVVDGRWPDRGVHAL